MLRPIPGKGLSTGLITEGRGKIGSVYRHTSSTNVGAFRRGNALTFFILGPGYGNVRSVAVETVSDPGLLPKRTLALDGTPSVGTRLWDKFPSLHPIDLHVQTADPSGLSCPELQNLLDSIDADLDARQVRAAAARERDLRLEPLQLERGGRLRPVHRPADQLQRRPRPASERVHDQQPPLPEPAPERDHQRQPHRLRGGLLSTGQNFTLNLQTSPIPPAGIGGQLFGIANGTTFGPFTITGP